MKNIVLIFLIMLVSVVCLKNGICNEIIGQPQTGTLTVKVINFKHSQGSVCVLAFDSKEGFPDKSEKAYLRKDSVICNGECTVAFEKIPFGSVLAVSMLHDENCNGDMDKARLIGFPLEGFGTSFVNKLQMPSFKKSKFEFTEDREITVTALYLGDLFRWLLRYKKDASKCAGQKPSQSASVARR